jgi:hypothetical protein
LHRNSQNSLPDPLLLLVYRFDQCYGLSAKTETVTKERARWQTHKRVDQNKENVLERTCQ